MLRWRPFEALRYRGYRLLSGAQLFGNLGTWMDEVSRGWLIYQLTNSAVQLGLVRGIQIIPFLLLSPIAGSAADRYSRKGQLLLAQSLNGVVFAIMAALVFSGFVQPWHVYVSAFLAAVVQVFQQPARAAMVSDTVPPEYLTNAIGFGSLLFNVARITGPALAGALIALSSTAAAFTVQAVFLFMATRWTVQIGEADQHANVRPGTHSGSFIDSIVEGWQFSWRSEPVRAGLLCTMTVSLLMVPFTTLLPVFARDLLGVGATGQGLMLTAMGAGALMSATLIASAGHRLPRGVLMLCFSTLYGVVLVAFALSSSYTLSLLLMTLVGLCHVHANALVQTIIQSYSPAELRGRTLALFNMNQLLVTIGSIFIGALAAPFGPRWAVIVMAIAGSAAMLSIALAMPYARRIR